VTDSLTALCLPNGVLNPDARGWSARPRLDSTLHRRWGRNKRWDYWCVIAEPLVIQLTVVDLDYLQIGTAAVFDLADGPLLERVTVRPPGRWIQQGGIVDGPVHFTSRKLEMDFLPTDEGTHLKADFDGVHIDVLAAPPGDSLNVVVPWTDRRFQFTSKQIGRGATGTVDIDGEVFDIDGHAALDFGRGRWPLRTRWNWGAGAGQTKSGFVGLQLGSQWTDGTGQNENGVFLDGVLHKLDCDLAFERTDTWRVFSTEGDAVDLRLVPLRERPMRGGPIGSLDLSFGHWQGQVRAHGQVIQIEDILGWAEEMRVRW